MPPPEPTLNDTLARAGRGDQAAWRALVELYSRRVYALLVRQCGDRELAEEITQATFVKLVSELGRYNEQGRFEPWLFRIAMNGLRDEMRRRKRQARTIAPGSEDSETSTGGWQAVEGRIVERELGGIGVGGNEQPLEALTRAEQVAMLRRAVAQLPAADQEILTLRHTTGLSFAQIAESLGEPLGTVLARGHRALAKLRKLIEKQENESE
jgi:RNA polymerase sigma-70 factor, ECF subfamily